MGKIKFIFGIHNHQPIGNFDFVFEEAYQKSYLPFLQILEKHPKIRISLHFTGILLDWLEQHHPELLELVRKLRNNGQLEMMSGGYYEPILTVIPYRDRLNQIKKLTQRVKQLFDYDASGMWLAERIWEPTLPSSLYDAGIKYTVVDDTHFKYAGLRDNDLDGYFISEDLGKSVALFPISKQLRYTIPFQEPQATIDELRKMSSESGNRILVFADDGEKFGVWPDTYKHVYENNWLDNFFSVIEENLDWIEMITFDEALQQVKPKSNIYLPTASYAEMMHWSLFKETYKAYENFEHYLQDHNMYDDVGIFVRGGFWRNFMTKYPEINVMHKKMLRVSDKLAAVNDKNLNSALDALMAAQCNCPYWHGVFGGLYLSHLRQAIFGNLIKAEKLIASTHPKTLVDLEITDFDKDGYEEVLVETPVHNAYFKPDRGASMFLYDFKASEKNLLDTMTRREEGYHEKLHHAHIAGQDNIDTAASIHDLVIAKEPGLEKYLIYDTYERKSFIDHIWDDTVSIDNFYNHEYQETGDFFNGVYVLDKTEKLKDKIQLFFSRSGNVRQSEQTFPVKITKIIDIDRKQEIVSTKYTLTNLSDTSLKFIFAVECNYGLQAGHAHDRYYYNEAGKLDNAFLDSVGETNDSFIGLKDEYMKIDIQLKGKNLNRIWRVPVETISLSEAGFEKVYQSSCILLIWDLNLDKQVELELLQKTGTF